MKPGQPKPLPKKRLTANGLPVESRDWTEQDWRSMHVHVEAIKREIAARHRPKDEAKK